MEKKPLNRRTFLKRAAIAGGAVWAIPVVQSVSASPAWANSLGTVCPTENCFQSQGCNGGCAGACGGKCGGKQCFGFGKVKNGPCAVYCHHPGMKNQCPCGQLCEDRFFICSPANVGVATYTGAPSC